MAAFEGKPFEVAEEPIGLYQDYKPESWWDRLWN
jgi:hypothetical protein